MLQDAQAELERLHGKARLSALVAELPNP